MSQQDLVDAAEATAGRQNPLLPGSLTARPWKWMVGRLVSYWRWHTFRDYVSSRECNSSTFCRVSWVLTLFLEDSSSYTL